MNASMTRRDLFVFLSTLCLATFAIQIAAIVAIGDMNDPRAMPFLLLSMFMPTFWTAGWLWRRPQLRREIAWRFGRPLPSLGAALIPGAIALAAVLTFVALGWGSSKFFVFAGSGVDVLAGPFQLGKGVQSWPFFLANFAATAIFFALVNSSAAVGEELGWRGLLQNQLIARFGLVGGIALLGVVWAYWHLPVNLAGYNFGAHPMLGAFVLFPIQLVAASFVMAWLTRRAGSFWPAVVYHGSGNGILQGVAVGSIVPAAPQLALDLVVIGIECLFGALACWALVREERRTVTSRAGSASETELVRAA